jgi:site-specific recombinase XerD
MNQTTTHRAASVVRKPAAYSDRITEELHRYEEHMRDVRGLAEGSCRQRVHIVGRLLHKKFADRPIVITELRAEDVRHFLANQLDALRTPSNALQLASAMRSYFRYRATCGDQVGKLTAAISSPAHWKLASLPRALKPEEAERLLNSFTVNLRLPKRGYAIVRCALDMGLRAGEIAHLMINDIDWRAGTVMLRGTKSLRQDIMPLPMETGQALADYIQHERPATPNPAIFVRQMKGRNYPITSTAIQKVIKRACRRVDLPHSSAHALRHTLACRLVESGSSLKEVADLLRHRSLTTTLIYAKLDSPKLLAVALPWPGRKL